MPMRFISFEVPILLISIFGISPAMGTPTDATSPGEPSLISLENEECGDASESGATMMQMGVLREELGPAERVLSLATMAAKSTPSMGDDEAPASLPHPAKILLSEVKILTRVNRDMLDPNIVRSIAVLVNGTLLQQLMDNKKEQQVLIDAASEGIGGDVQDKFDRVVEELKEDAEPARTCLGQMKTLSSEAELACISTPLNEPAICSREAMMKQDNVEAMQEALEQCMQWFKKAKEMQQEKIEECVETKHRVTKMMAQCLAHGTAFEKQACKAYSDLRAECQKNPRIEKTRLEDFAAVDASVRAAEAELIREYMDVQRIIHLLNVLQSDMNTSEANESVEDCLKNQPDASPIRIRYPNITKYDDCGISGLSDFLTTRVNNFSYEELFPKGNLNDAVKCAGGAGTRDADPLDAANSNPSGNQGESQSEAPDKDWELSSVVRSGPSFTTTTQSEDEVGMVTSRGSVDSMSVRFSNVQLPASFALIGSNGEAYEIRIANGAASLQCPGDNAATKVILNPADILTLQVETGGVIKAYLNTLVMHTFKTTKGSSKGMRMRIQLQGVGTKFEVVENPLAQWTLTDVQKDGNTFIRQKPGKDFTAFATSAFPVESFSVNIDNASMAILLALTPVAATFEAEAANAYRLLLDDGFLSCRGPETNVQSGIMYADNDILKIDVSKGSLVTASLNNVPACKFGKPVDRGVQVFARLFLQEPAASVTVVDLHAVGEKVPHQAGRDEEDTSQKTSDIVSQDGKWILRNVELKGTDFVRPSSPRDRNLEYHATSAQFVQNITVRIKSAADSATFGLVPESSSWNDAYRVMFENGLVTFIEPGIDKETRTNNTGYQVLIGIPFTHYDVFTLSVDAAGAVTVYVDNHFIHRFELLVASPGSVRGRIVLESPSAQVVLVPTPLIAWELTDCSLSAGEFTRTTPGHDFTSFAASVHVADLITVRKLELNSLAAFAFVPYDRGTARADNSFRVLFYGENTLAFAGPENDSRSESNYSIYDRITLFVAPHGFVSAYVNETLFHTFKAPKADGMELRAMLFMKDNTSSFKLEPNPWVEHDHLWILGGVQLNDSEEHSVITATVGSQKWRSFASTWRIAPSISVRILTNLTKTILLLSDPNVDPMVDSSSGYYVYSIKGKVGCGGPNVSSQVNVTVSSGAVLEITAGKDDSVTAFADDVPVCIFDGPAQPHMVGIAVLGDNESVVELLDQPPHSLALVGLDVAKEEEQGPHRLQRRQERVPQILRR